MAVRQDATRENFGRVAVPRRQPRETAAIDLAGLAVAVIMMLGPLAAAALTRGTY